MPRQNFKWPCIKRGQFIKSWGWPLYASWVDCICFGVLQTYFFPIPRIFCLSYSYSHTVSSVFLHGRALHRFSLIHSLCVSCTWSPLWLCSFPFDICLPIKFNYCMYNAVFFPHGFPVKYFLPRSLGLSDWPCMSSLCVTSCAPRAFRYR